MSGPIKLQMINPLETYLNEAIFVTRNLPLDQIEEAYDVINGCIVQQKQIFIVGNGGSASNASHFAMEINKNFTAAYCPRAISLSDNISTITALANDKSFSRIFAEQLYSLANEGDLLIAFSNSGNSQNILCALDAAKSGGLITLGITGNNPSNALASFVDHSIIIPSTDSGHIENAQQTICHMIIARSKEVTI